MDVVFSLKGFTLGSPQAFFLYIPERHTQLCTAARAGLLQREETNFCLTMSYYGNCDPGQVSVIALYGYISEINHNKYWVFGELKALFTKFWSIWF